MYKMTSIHLGNNIVIVQAPPTINKEGTTHTALPRDVVQAQTNDVHVKGALEYEISWLKFLRESEEEYLNRLTRVSIAHNWLNILHFAISNTYHI